jgi:uncharacterized protein
MRKIIVVISLLLLMFSITPAWALDISAAKQAGLIGETNNGYVATVKPNPAQEVTQLVSSVNNARKEEYKKIAARNGQSLDVVEKLAAVKLIERTQAGNFVMDQNGQWVMK